ncbi:MAG: squalene/phytoene synthase family protein [Wenzhouxiangellaceae bacterium]|nr:squalene/phytoene synthase family protein [Wenzhouxiangellaceae bacterium]
MAVQPSTESPLDWCARRLLVPGHPLSITLPYAAAGLRDRILSLNAVISEIASIPGAVSDPDVARRKLDWWGQALVEQAPHPALQAWIASGGAEVVDAQRFDALIAAVGLEIEPPRFEQLAALESHCRCLAGPAARLEAELTDGQSAAGGSADDELDGAKVHDRLVDLAAAGYKIRMARDLVIDARQDRWLVPLELQAEYQLTRQQVAAGEGAHRLAALVRHLVVDAIGRIDREMAELAGAPAWRHRHQVLRAHLDRRLGRLLLRRPGRIVRERVLSTGPLATFSVWRQARRLR